MGLTINSSSEDYYYYYDSKASFEFCDETIKKEHYRHISQVIQNENKLHEQIRTEEDGGERKQCKPNQKTRRRILVVDDEPDTCLSYQIVLQNAGYECRSYIDSVRALQEYRPFYYDLTILDIKMPVLNRFKLCKKITEIDNITQIIFITAAGGYYKKLRKQSYPELGSIASIQKPIGNEELIKAIDMVLATKKAN